MHFVEAKGILMDIFRRRCIENGIIYDANECFQYLHAFPEKYEQMSFVENLLQDS